MIRPVFQLAFVFAFFAQVAWAEVLVFAAASLKEPLDRIAAQFGDVVVSYGGSGTLARQVSLGAPADVVLLANVAWMDVLVDGKHVQPASTVDFASNRLVVIGPAGAGPLALDPITLDQDLGTGRIAVGLTEAVPAGIYAKAALRSLGLWDAVRDHLAEVDSVRSALTLVIRGQVPLGVVYQTDVRISDAITQRAVFPSESHPPIRYVGAVAHGADPEAEAFLSYMTATEGQAILAEAGFLPPLDSPQ